MNELYDDENAHTIISDKDELEDLFDFILMNEHISIENDSPFNRKVIIDIKRAINNDHKYGLTEEQVNTIKKGFIDSKDAFHLNTPKIITSDRECFKAALEISIDSIDYTFLAEEEEFEDRIIELAKKQKYILKEISPCYLKSNYEVSLNSLSLDVNSADWIEWYCFEDKPEELNNLLEIIIKNGKYELSYNSHDILCKNRDIIMCSIKRDVDTFHYAETSPEEDHEIFKYLVLHDYYNENDLKYYFSINNFIDKDIIGYLLENSCLGFNFWTMDDAVRETYHSSKSTNLYFERVTELYYKALSTAPKISNFETALRYFSETVWEKKRNDNINYYGNIFNKICSALRANSFDDACNSLAFLKNMKDMLGAKQYDELIKTMRTYYNLYSEKKTSSDDFQNARDKISELSAKYIAISKENTKNEWIKNCYYDIKIREYYKIKKDNPLIIKLVTEGKQKQIFRKRYNSSDSDTMDLIGSLYGKYQNEIDITAYKAMIDAFITDNYKLEFIINPPYGWYGYKQYKEACKLITRLNCNYIKYDSEEVANYDYIIDYDEENNKYYYSGVTFNSDELESCAAYEKLSSIFKEIKKELMKEIKKIELETTEITDDDIDKINPSTLAQIPFTDEYYEFCTDALYNKDLLNFIEYCLPGKVITPSSILDDNNYNLLTNYIINNNLIWLSLIEAHSWDTEDYPFNDQIKNPVLLMNDIVNLANTFDYDVNKFADVQELCKLKEYADDKAIAILGPKIIPELCNSQAYTDGNYEKIIEKATDLVVAMAARDSSTVPYVNGTYCDYNYSIYNPQDEEILLAGIRTDACFKIKGNDNDFLHYCALNKNGFVLKITNSNGEFIARGSGFRNGNCIYINQLRTIYDDGGRGYFGKDPFEREEIINTFYAACQDIVNTSQNNPKETNKIDFVFTNAAYAIPKAFANVSNDVKEAFGHYPHDNKNADWEKFKHSTKNLRYPNSDYFTTDFGDYGLVCVASSKKEPNNLPEANDIKLYTNNKPIYKRTRNEITITDKPNIDVLNKINKIKAINAVRNNEQYQRINITGDCIILTGDNWYIIYDKNANMIVSKCLITCDKYASLEYYATLEALKENAKETNIENINNYKRILKQNANKKLKEGAKNAQ